MDAYAVPTYLAIEKVYFPVEYTGTGYDWTAIEADDMCIFRSSNGDIVR